MPYSETPMKGSLMDNLTHLESTIEHVLSELSGFSSETEEFQKATDQLSKLYKMKEIELEQRQKRFEAESKAIQHAAELQIKQIEADAVASLKAAEVAAKLDEIDSRKRVSKDTMAIVAGNLVGILAIVGYERLNVVTSKALGLVMKTR